MYYSCFFFVFCWVLSYGRTEVLALGSFAVNISQCPLLGAQSLSFATSYFSVLQDLVPKVPCDVMFFFFVRFFTAMSLFSSLFVVSPVLQCHFLPMTLTNMNTLRFTPKKDYETNRMQSGKLQFSAGVSRLIFTHAFTHSHVHIPPTHPPIH